MHFKNVLKVGFVLAVLLVLQQCKAPETNGDQNDKAAIEQVMKDQQAAWNQGQIEKFMHGYLNSPNLAFVGSNGVERGYDTVLERYKKHYPDRETMGKLSFTDLEFIPAGKGYYLVMGKFELKRKSDNPSGFFTLLWKKTPQGWKIINDHSSG